MSRTYSLIVASALCASVSAKAQTIEVSAPLFPQVLLLYPYEAALYPTTPEGQKALADEVILTFEWLRDTCAELGYGVALDAGTGLTADERSKNYNEVARCSYEHFTAKPYLIPQLVQDVDVCALKLGSEWRLPTEADLLSWPDEFYAAITDVLGDTAGGASWWGGFYFSLAVFVRDDVGALRIGNLHADAVTRVMDLPATVDMTRHLEGVPFDLTTGTGYAAPVVRCVREIGVSATAP